MSRKKKKSRAQIIFDRMVSRILARNGMYLKIAGGLVAGVLLVVYISGIVYYSSHYLKGTVINGIDVSKMTVEQLENTIKEYSLTIKERGKDGNEVYIETISGKDINIHVVSGSGINDIMSEQSRLLWFKKGQHKFEKETLIEYDKEALHAEIDALKGLNKKYADKPVSAKVSAYEEGKGYHIIEEKQGNFLNKNKTREMVEDAVCNLDGEINLDGKECYKKPKVSSKDDKIVELVGKLNTYTGVKVTYQFGETKEIVDGKMISGWLDVKEFEVALNTSKIEEYVATLRKKYDTIFRDRKFKTSYGKTVKVKGGDYGWWMNYTKEAEELKTMIEGGIGGERKPVYYQEAAQYGENDYGNTYVEINLTAQRLFVYKEGIKVLETDVVSGNASRKMSTPVGTYGITYKERYSMLVGETYESIVSYWMPFNGDIGMHDAIWKTEFGKEFYKTDGSHGCINLPYLTAKKIYDVVEKGTPVICYKLKGTESTSVTNQSRQEIAQAAVEAIDAIGKVTKESKDEIAAARYMYNKVGAESQQYVTNYNKLKEAEKQFKELNK